MIEVRTDAATGVVAVRARGTLTREEHDTAVVPLLDEARRSGGRLRIPCEVGSGYTAPSPAVRHVAHDALDEAVARAGATDRLEHTGVDS